MNNKAQLIVLITR